MVVMGRGPMTSSDTGQARSTGQGRRWGGSVGAISRFSRPGNTVLRGRWRDGLTRLVGGGVACCWCLAALGRSGRSQGLSSSQSSGCLNGAVAAEPMPRLGWAIYCACRMGGATGKGAIGPQDEARDTDSERFSAPAVRDAAPGLARPSAVRPELEKAWAMRGWDTLRCTTTTRTPRTGSKNQHSGPLLVRSQTRPPVGIEPGARASCTQSGAAHLLLGTTIRWQNIPSAMACSPAKPSLCCLPSSLDEPARCRV